MSTDEAVTAGSDAALGPRGVRIAVSLWLVVVVSSALGPVLWARAGFPDPEQTHLSGLGFLALVAGAITQSSIGLLLRLRRPDLPFGMAALGVSLAFLPPILGAGYLPLAAGGGAPVDPIWLAWLTSSVAIPIGVGLSILIGLLFPDGRLLSPRWGWAVVLAAAACVLTLIVRATMPGPLLGFPGYENPLGSPGSEIGPIRRLLADLVSPILLVLAVALTGAAFVARYRAADSIGRLQMRWYVSAAVVTSVGFILNVYVLVRMPDGDRVAELLSTFFYGSIAVPPIALFIAISRYRLWGIDRILGRAFVYGSLTAILAGLYAASIRLFNFVFVELTGESSEVALVITTLLLATTFTPLKARLEHLASDRLVVTSAAAPAAPAGALEGEAFDAAVEAAVRRVLAERESPRS